MIKKYTDSPKIINLIKYLYYSFSLMLIYLNNYRDILNIDNNKRLKKLFLYFRYGLYKFYSILIFMIYSIFIIFIHIISVLLRKIYNIKNTKITKTIYRKINNIKRYTKYIFRRFKSKEFLLKYTIERINANIQKRIIKNQQRLQKDKTGNKTKNNNIEIETKMEIDLNLNINILHEVKHLFANVIKLLTYVPEVTIIKPITKCIAILFIGNKLKTKPFFNKKINFVPEKFNENSKLDIKRCISVIFDKLINDKECNSFGRIKNRDVFEICNNIDKFKNSNRKTKFGYQLNSDYKCSVIQSDRYRNRDACIVSMNTNNFKDKNNDISKNKYINAKNSYILTKDDNINEFISMYNDICFILSNTKYSLGYD